MTKDFNADLFSDRDKNLPSKEVGNSPRCDSCKYVIPSYTSSTGLRCGLEYSRASALMKKLRRMDFYPIVKVDNACELWEIDGSC